ncbi:hypothetical protein [Aquabacterium humicola]|uniref:hypothetical protein n=1 Tax=Aquabacterium humicola TaxID=3237377 RepID=UPI002542E79A|nr:hypothetical protein [Rubrivivax pictus]
MNGEKLYYVSLSAADPTNKTDPNGVHARAANLILHVYVRAIDDIYASAAASDVCAELGCQFRSFIYLPKETDGSAFLPGEEHAAAYRFAIEHGLSYIASRVFDCNHRQVDLPQFS